MAEGIRIVALAGGVGAARFLRGLVKVCDPETITIIGNTGDDREFYGVHVSPDLDIVTYTLAGKVNASAGFGLEGDHFSIIDTLSQFGHDTWFRLGDLDFSTCLHRTLKLKEGASLTDVTRELGRYFEIGSLILPMSDGPCPTFIRLNDGRRMHFEEYLIRDGAPNNVSEIDLSAAKTQRPGPQVIPSILHADVIFICPSNPVVSIGPILALSGVKEALHRTQASVVAVSPIVGGSPIKGPADRLLKAIGVEVSARGIASLYSDFCKGMIFDEQDVEQLDAIKKLGYQTSVLDTLMVDQAKSEAVALAAVRLAENLS